MSTLHLVRKSGFVTNDLAQCLSIVQDHDTIVLIDDGCYNLSHPLITTLIKANGTKPTLKVVEPHAQARGVTSNESVCAINLGDVVNLTFSNVQVITWQ